MVFWSSYLRMVTLLQYRRNVCSMFVPSPLNNVVFGEVHSILGKFYLGNNFKCLMDES